jgi:hypothetical protein
MPRAVGAMSLPLLANLLPPQYQALARPILAILGGAGGESVRMGYEQSTGAAPGTTGTPGERMLRAGAASGIGQGVAELGSAGANYLANRSGATAASRVADIGTEGALPATVAAKAGAPVATAKAAAFPFLLKGGPAQAGGTGSVLARSWWRQASANGPQGVVEAWGLTPPEARAQIFGDAVPQMEQFVTALGQGAGSLKELAGPALQGAGGALAKAMGFGTVATVLGIGSAKGAASATVSKALPFAMGKIAVRPGGLPLLRTVTQALENPANHMAGRAAAQTAVGLGADLTAPPPPRRR